jgi:enolase
MKIDCINLRKIFNSRGEETTEAIIFSDDKVGVGSAPSGASVSSKETKLVELEEGIKKFEKIKKKFYSDFNQKKFDDLLIKNLDEIGSNITTALSFAFFNLDKESFIKNTKGRIPFPLGNVIGGGKHAGKMDIQEILVLPVKAKNIYDAIRINFEIWKEIKEKHTYKFLGINDEGALIMDFGNEEALETVSEIARKYKAKVGIDLAASELYHEDYYFYDGSRLHRGEQIELIKKWIKDYNLYYIEDPLEENDSEGFAELTNRFGYKCLIVGDDLFATQEKRLNKKVANSVIVKPNQVGTVSGALSCIEKAKKLKMVPVLSHRSGETCDTTIAFLSLLTPIAKFGISQIRIAKLNELIRIWKLLEICNNFKDKKPKMAKL